MNKTTPPTQEERLMDALFEQGDYGIREVTLPAKFPFDAEAKPLYEGNIVSKPLAIAKEGVYIKGIERNGKIVAQKIRITANDLSQMVKNSTRDVPLNEEHWRGGPNHHGWVRSHSMPMEVRKDEDGRNALFASIEVTPEVISLVDKGHYRDFSPELDLMQKRLRGLALTNYPVMQEIHQFSEILEENDTTLFEEEPVDTDAMKAELMSELKGQMEAQFSEQLNSLKSELEAERTARKDAERESRTNQLTLEFSEKIQKLLKNDKGEARILPAQADNVLQLYMFAAMHPDATVNFGEGETAKSVTPVQLLDEVFNHLPPAALYKQEVQDGQEVDEFAENADTTFDTNAVAARVRSILKERN